MWAANGLAVLTEERERAARIYDRLAAILAAQTLCTTRNRGKYIVGVHRANNKGTAIPRGFTGHTAQLTTLTL